jgi:MinD superfamily P-loop ATPase
MTNEIAIISGKGGTGKTTICAAFAVIAEKAVMADCDVDAPDLHILLNPKVESSHDFIGSKVAEIDNQTCTQCGLCESTCRFEAIHENRVDPIACEGCKVCVLVCPEGAIRMKERISGHIFASTTRVGMMAHAKLIAGEGNSGKLVTEVRKLAAQMASNNESSTVLIDGSPGIGCPVIATVTGIKLGIVVTEPTMSGIHDMRRVIDLLKRFRVTTAVIINKFDINLENSNEIERYCHESDVEVLGNIKFDLIMTQSMVAAATLPEYAPNHDITRQLESMWCRVEEILNN